MSTSIITRLVGGVATTVLLAAGATAPALAAPTAPSATPSAAPSATKVTTSTQAMQVVGFDAALAKKAGNKITKEGQYSVLRDRRGTLISRVPVKPAAGARAFNTVYGNCGSSFFYLYDLAGASFALRTGFSVKRTAVSYGWDTRTIGQNSFQTDNWEWGNGGPIASSSWSSGYVKSSQDTYAGTYYYGRVTSGWALLWTGEVCASGMPNAGITLYK